MRKHIVLTLLVAGVAGAATVTAPMVHPQAASGRVIPVTVRNFDTGESTLVDRDVAYNFNGDTQGWVAHGTGVMNDTWHVEPVGHNGTYTNTWWSGDVALGGYTSSHFVYLDTPAINMVGAVSPTLTFALYYACEAPGGEPAPYNGWDGANVWASTDGGTTWAVISGTPTYNVSNSFAFGDEFGMGPGIPEWGGTAAGWANANFNLSSFIGQSDLRLRFVFCADPAFDTSDDPNLIGMQIDNVVVSAGGTLWSDDGVTNVGGAPTHSYYVFGVDAWTHTGAEWNCADGLRLGSYIESPWITYTPPALIVVEQDLRVDLPDSDGDNDGFLEDYFFIEWTADGITWTELTHDYAGGSRPNWMAAYYHYTDADVYNGSLDFTRPTGTQIKLRYRVNMDDNFDGGQGTGLWVDNVTVTTAAVLAHDLALNKLWINYPRNVSQTQYPKVEFENRGSSQEINQRAYWRVFNDSTNVLVRASQPLNTTALTIEPLSTVRAEQTAGAPLPWKWTPTATPAVYRVQAYAQLASDLNRSNDSLTILVNAFQPNVGFLKYDYGTSSAWTLAQNPGDDGGLVRYDPIPSDWTAQFFFARVYNVVAGDEVHIAIHAKGPNGQTPGALLNEYTTLVTGPEDVYPNTMIRYVGTIPELRCIGDTLWVGIRSNANNATGVVGLSGDNGGPYWDQHTYAYDYLASTAAAWNGDLQMWLQVDWGVESEIPFTIALTGTRSGSNYTLDWDSPGPVDGYFVYRSVDGYFTPGAPVATLPAGTTTWTDTIPGVGRFFYKVVGYNGMCPVN